MIQDQTIRIPQLLKTYQDIILTDWIQKQLSSLSSRKDLIKESELTEQSKQLLQLIQQALQNGDVSDISATNWQTVRAYLEEISKIQTQLGFSPSETATFIFSLKQPLFSILRKEYGKEAETLANELWVVTLLIDKLGLYSTEVHLKTKEQIIKRQQDEMLELSTPVVKLWEGILALPMIGTLDSSRTQVVMENLLQKIVETGCEIAIIDITGVPNVDTLVAQHLLKTITAARLMGAECLISGVRPQIAQTIVHLGVDLSEVITKASLADAFKLALQRTQQGVQNNTMNASSSPLLTHSR